MEKTKIEMTRKELGLTQQDMASLCNISEKKYRSYEQGTVKGDLDDIQRICYHLHIPLSEYDARLVNEIPLGDSCWNKDLPNESVPSPPVATSEQMKTKMDLEKFEYIYLEAKKEIKRQQKSLFYLFFACCPLLLCINSFKIQFHFFRYLYCAAVFPIWYFWDKKFISNKAAWESYGEKISNKYTLTREAKIRCDFEYQKASRNAFGARWSAVTSILICSVSFFFYYIQTYDSSFSGFFIYLLALIATISLSYGPVRFGEIIETIWLHTVPTIDNDLRD